MDRSVTIQTPGPHGGGKLAFANQLRAVAALCVVLSHLGGVYVLMGPLVGWITSSPETHVGPPGGVVSHGAAPGSISAPSGLRSSS